MLSKTRTVYECDTCGRFDVKPIPPNHFHPNVHDGVCGQPTVAREYVLRDYADRMEDDLARLHGAVARRGYDDPEPESLIKYREVVHS